MSELSCDTPFIGQIETHDLVRNHEGSGKYHGLAAALLLMYVCILS
jgi:hypothetical protein